MEIKVKNLSFENKTKDFGVIRPVGTFSTNDAGDTTISLNGKVTPQEFKEHDDAAYVYDKDLGTVSVKERLSLSEKQWSLF